MDNFDDIQKFATFLGSVIAAISSSVMLSFKYFEKHDNVKVEYGSMGAALDPKEYLHVLSRCDHTVVIKDFGFIEKDGTLFSLPYYWEENMGEEAQTFTRGSTTLTKRGDYYEVGEELQRGKIGAYAVTAGQTKPRLAFRWKTPYWQRMKIRFKVKFRLEYR